MHEMKYVYTLLLFYVHISILYIVLIIYDMYIEAMMKPINQQFQISSISTRVAFMRYIAMIASICSSQFIRFHL